MLFEVLFIIAFFALYVLLIAGGVYIMKDNKKYKTSTSTTDKQPN